MALPRRRSGSMKSVARSSPNVRAQVTVDIRGRLFGGLLSLSSLSEMGLTLEEVGAELAKLPKNRVPEPTDWEKLSASWTRRIDEGIAELERLRAGLTRCIGCGCLSLQDCQLANPGDRASRLGPGPRFWMGDKRLQSKYIDSKSNSRSASRK